MKLTGALWVFALLIWLPFEDNSIWLSLALASSGCVWLALRLKAFASAKPLGLALRGGLLGASIPLTALTLMAFKSGLHGHGFADYTARQVWLLLQISPLFVVIGAAIGFMFTKGSSN